VPAGETSGSADVGQADRPQQLKAPELSLPKGGGAIRGIGEKFAANPVTGTGSMTVPILTSPGRSGFGPRLSLSYDSGAGNGPFGFGWSLALPAVTRKTDKGLPQYRDTEESDVFILSGAEDLVPMFAKHGAGQWLIRDGEHVLREKNHTLDGQHYRVRRYLPRIEGLFACIERWTRDDGDVHWRSLTRDNVLTIYGADENSRIADPADSKRVFSWLICETRDDKGNALVYTYRPEDEQQVDLARAHERNRVHRGANRYLKRIRYGNRVPLLDDEGGRPLRLSGAELDDAGWMFEVVFDYGDHDADRPGSQDHEVLDASGDPKHPWACRKDAFSTHRAGFEVRTYRLCRRVLMFHHFAGEDGVGADCLVRSTDFVHSNGGDSSGAGDGVYSFLLSVRQTGYRKSATGGYLAKSMPSVAFEYAQPVVQDRVEEVDPRSLEHLPIGVEGRMWQWTDLHGEGIPGILTEQATAWFYKRNLSPLNESQVEFAPLERVASQPNLALAGGHAQFMDLAGDGLPDLVVMDGQGAGLHEHDDAEGWQPFRPFTSRPNRDLRGPNVRFIDLDGDGHADVLIAEDDAFVWHASLAEEGFGPARRVARALDEEKGPRLVFDDGTQSIHLADMSGDGLTDLVRIRNGEVCYWPNIGYGRFGAKVTMDWPAGPDPPRCFDNPDQFDPKRIRLADIDGGGTTDIIYLHRDGVRLYFNQSGNSWSEPRQLSVFPRVDELANIAPADLLGNGTACLVWSSPLPGDAGRQMRYVNLMGQSKPHLLVRTLNNLGAETRIEYSPSTRFYLQDKRAGIPWITRLPFPVHVVERVVTLDRVSGNRFVSRYTYHHGYFDGEEREFRGFGRVEQWDTAEMGVLAEREASQSTNFDEASFVPPVHTRSWFHTGACLNAEVISRQFESEYYREPGLDDTQFRSLLLPDTSLPETALTLAEEREACRALKGLLLRQEVYAEDAAPGPTDDIKAKTPFIVSEQSFTIRCLQPRGQGRHAVFLSHAREALAFHYERKSNDPRVQHTLTLGVDEYGNVLDSAVVAYGRRFDAPEQSLQPQDREKQRLIHITYTHNTFSDDVIDDFRTYRLRGPAESRTYELRRAEQQRVADGVTQLFAFDAVSRFADQAADDRYAVPYEDLDFKRARQVVAESDDIEQERQSWFRRLIERVRTRYRSDDLTALLPLHALQSRGLPGESYKLAFTPGLLAQVYLRNGAALLPDTAQVLGMQDAGGGGYVDLDGDGHWWIPSGQVFYSLKPADAPAQELSHALSHFFLPHRYRDPFGQNTLISYDSDDTDPEKNHNLLVVRSEDAVGNTVTVVNDYRVLQPSAMTDPNGNRTEVRFDALGMVVATAVMGKQAGAGEGDSFAVFGADLTSDEIDAYLDAPDPRVLAHKHLGTASSRVIYDFTRVPACTAAISRETHVSDLGAGEKTRLQLAFSYSDGFGREVQKKIQAEPGPAPMRNAEGHIVVAEGGQPQMTGGDVSPRWVGSGWTIFNNKGNPIRRFEPFFSDTHKLDRDVRIGVSAWLFYDPLDRIVATLHPNHTWEKVVFDAWRQTTFDVNDTLPRFGGDADPKSDPDVGDFFRRLADEEYRPGWYELRTAPEHAVALAARYPDERDRKNEAAAAAKAIAHANTPTVAHFDTLGRTFLTQADNGPGPAQPGGHVFFSNRIELDIEGNQRSVRDAVEQANDPLGRIVMRYAYDMLGNRIHQLSMEAGARWMLNDSVGSPIRMWDDRGHTFRTGYDSARRPARFHVKGASPGAPAEELLTERIVYGEQHPEARQRNLRGKVFLHLDQAGLLANETYDFKGNLLRGSRRLATEYKRAIDWRAIDDDHTALPLDAQAQLDLAALDVALNARLEAGGYTDRKRYDALNRPIQWIAPRGGAPGMKINVIQPSYNEANLLEQVNVWTNSNAEPAGLLDAASANLKAVRGISYDAKGRRERIDYGNGASSFHEYDPFTLRLRHLLTRRDPASFQEDCPQPPPDGWPGCQVQNLHYTYDPAGNITHIRDDAQQTIYFKNRRVEPGNEYTYDALYRLIRATGREHLGQGGVPLPHSCNDTGRARRTSADGAGRFAPNDAAAMGTYIEQYVYDAVGNFERMKHERTDAQVPGWTRSYFYEEASLIEDGADGAPLKRSNRLSRTIVVNGSPEPYGYDAHGNMQRMPQLQVMQWDYKDELRMTQRQKVNEDDAEGIEKHGERTWYVYDASGQRVRKITERANGGGLKDERIYLGTFEIFRQHSGVNAGLVREALHITDDEQRIALVETRNEVDDGSAKQLTRYQFNNHLGSASLELDDAAQIISYEEYTPYGSTSYQAVRSQTESAKRYRYTGKERDEESGLYYHGARYYAPWLGRWTQADPDELVDGLDLYTYCRGHPIRFVDSTGGYANELLQKAVEHGPRVMLGLAATGFASTNATAVAAVGTRTLMVAGGVTVLVIVAVAVPVAVHYYTKSNPVPYTKPEDSKAPTPAPASRIGSREAPPPPSPAPQPKPAPQVVPPPPPPLNPSVEEIKGKLVENVWVPAVPKDSMKKPAAPSTGNAGKPPGNANKDAAAASPERKRPSAAKHARDAKAAGLVDAEKGRVGVQTHNRAASVRAAEGTSGETHQSAHIVPQAVYRQLGKSPGRALTSNLPKEIHSAIDKGWVSKWNAAIASGQEITARDVQQWVGDAIERVPAKMLSAEAKGTLQWLLHQELYDDLGLKPESTIVPKKKP